MNSSQSNWRTFPSRTVKAEPSKLRWKRGRPIVPGADVSGNKDKWGNFGLSGFNFANLSKIYPWAKVFRGGIIPIWNRRVLLVKEKDRIIIDDDEFADPLDGPWEAEIAPGYYGFAKGAVDFKHDLSILETAIREYEEEVGVKIKPEDIWFPTLIYERPEVGEVLVFFAVKYSEPPVFTINTDELDELRWFTLEELRPMRKQMSSPTRAIVHHLSNFTDLGL